MVVSVTKSTYNAPDASAPRRPMGTDSGPFSRRASPRGAPWPQAGPGAGGLGGRVVDPQHGRAMAPAAAVLPQLQDGASPLPAVVRTGGAARDSHPVGEYAARGRGDRRARELHRCDVCLGQRRRRGNRENPAWQRREDPRDCRSPWAAALGEHMRPIIMRSRWYNSGSTSTCWRPSPSTSLAIAPTTAMGWMTISSRMA